MMAIGIKNGDDMAPTVDGPWAEPSSFLPNKEVLSSLSNSRAHQSRQAIHTDDDLHPEGSYVPKRYAMWQYCIR